MKERLIITPEMNACARDFRKTPTFSEGILWQALRNRQVAGFKFRCQQPIGSFVVDFFCAEKGLIVEVDGAIHATQIEQNFQSVIAVVQQHFLLFPSPLDGEGLGVRGTPKELIP